MRIAKARREQRFNKVKALQWLLTHSLEAKLLAMKRVTSSQGAKTPGVDGKLYQCDSKKMQLALSLKQHGYKAQPLKRVYIPKRNGKRPLGIPTLYDRAMQALYLLAVEPVAEMQADPNSYGFRPNRSTADAAERCFKVLCNKHSVQWILEGDIKACFDTISHDWLLNNIPMERRILKQWLNAGFIEKQTLFPTTEGTPQGGIISPVAANIALEGLEEVVQQAASRKSKHKAHTVRYADDFVIMGVTKELLENDIKPAVERFLAERGLVLSLEKTKITHIEKGFDFLGFNVRKYQGKLLIKPSKSGVTTFVRKIREVVKTYKAVTAYELIGMLNPKIMG
jgi:RNA-directed DNA polymerase